MTVGCVVLAAGASSRMGTPKALLDAGGRSFVAAIAATARAAGVQPIVVVVGPPHEAAIRATLAGDWIVAHNPQPERGMLSSVQAGVRALPPVDATLVWPVDIPAVQPETVRAVLAAAPGSTVIPTHGGRGGHPLRVPAARFAELLAIDSPLGLRALLQAQPSTVVRLAVDDPAILIDVDTPEDLKRLP
jgi:molybdenum cofactor cytidylyltransferase